MKKRWIILLFIVIVCISIGGVIYMSSAQTEMISLVKGDEAKQTFEETLKNLDTLALAPSGKIQSYEIVEDSVFKNPMGGVNVVLIINNDEDLSIEFTLNDNDKILETGGISYSYELDELLKEK